MTGPHADELLRLTGDALALFDDEGRLVAASPSFRALFASIEGFLAPAVTARMILGEAVRHGLLTEDSAQRLIAAEGRLDPATQAEIALPVALGGIDFAVTLRATSDGGFAIRCDQATSDADDPDLEILMAKVLEACPTCLIMSRIGDGQILYRSPEATALLGKGFDSRAHFAHRAERADFITILLPTSRVDDMRFTAQRTDRSTFEAAISARLIEYRGDDVIVASVTDLTDDIALQKELARRKDQVFQAEKMSALGELLAGVAHELNNPLSIVVGNAHLLLEDDIDDAARRRVDKMTTAAERCVGIVKAFLDMARDRPMAIERIGVADLLQSVRDAFESGYTGPLRIDTLTAPGLADLAVDEVQIVQVMTNLMVNSEQAMRSGVGSRIELAAMAGPRPDRVRLCLTDDGPGVPEEIAGRIFEPLFTTKDVGQGTGIGLALCQRIVTAHGGAIELDRQHSGGARFVIDLPAAETIETESSAR